MDKQQCIKDARSLVGKRVYVQWLDKEMTVDSVNVREQTPDRAKDFGRFDFGFFCLVSDGGSGCTSPLHWMHTMADQYRIVEDN